MAKSPEGNGKKPPPAKFLECPAKGCKMKFVSIADLKTHVVSQHPEKGK